MVSDSAAREGDVRVTEDGDTKHAAQVDGDDVLVHVTDGLMAESIEDFFDFDGAASDKTSAHMLTRSGRSLRCSGLFLFKESIENAKTIFA